jgi:transposase
LERRSAQANAATRDLEKQMVQLLNGDPAGQRLLSIPGIGPITASALIGEGGDGSQFSCGRDFAASLGLTPRQRSTGGVVTLIGISKRGDQDLRTLLVLCARLICFASRKRQGRLRNGSVH